jgi:hypothetical protein
VLDDVLPPALGIVVTGRLGEPAERVGADLAGADQPGWPRLRAIIGGIGKHRGRGQVDEAGRHRRLGGETDGLPFRREVGERPERGASRSVRRVRENGDRRDQPGDVLEHGSRLRRPFDQDDVG